MRWLRPHRHNTCRPQHQISGLSKHLLLIRPHLIKGRHPCPSEAITSSIYIGRHVPSPSHPALHRMQNCAAPGTSQTHQEPK
ncbi:hypothetical protein AB672_10510 [Xylella taiwanensis]|nr:hypothetical protein AB672_10510 [Xylella taiwanensis]